MGVLLAERRFKYLLTLRITCFEVMQILHFGSCDLLIRGVQIRSDSFGFRNKNIHFGLDRIDKVVSYSDGSDFNWTSLCQLLDMYFLLLYLFG
jgi:hypothetical protein